MTAITLKEKFIEAFKSGKRFDIQNAEVITDEFAIGFAEWMSKYKFLPNKGWYVTSYQIEMDIFKTSKELLEIYKKEKQL